VDGTAKRTGRSFLIFLGEQRMELDGTSTEKEKTVRLFRNPHIGKEP
jgi:hypothetical protein